MVHIASAMLALMAAQPGPASSDADRACAVTLLAMAEEARRNPVDDDGASAAAYASAMFYVGRLSVAGPIDFTDLQARASALNYDRRKLGDDAVNCVRRMAAITGAPR